MKAVKSWVFLFFIIVICSSLPADYSFAQKAAIPAIKFKEVDIRIVLQAIAEKAVKHGQKVNIVVSPDVEGVVSVNLANVDWFTALSAVLRPYNYGYEWIGENILLVDSLEKIQEREKSARERQEIEPPRTKVFRLKFLDANDARRMIEPVLSPTGRASVLELTGQAGWEFGTDITKRERSKEGKASRTKVLIVSDISQKIEEIESLLAKIDVMPKQILIKTRLMEVNHNLLEDVGFDWGTGSTGATATSAQFITGHKQDGEEMSQIGVRGISPEPSISTTPSGASGITETAYQLIYRKIAGSQFELLIHALEEDAKTNTLSAPVILTMDNQEASILVGTKYPIVTTEISTETGQIVGGSLEEYKDIGIQLNVVPQICGGNDEFINMIIHPAVTSSTANVSITPSGSETAIVTYPIIVSREAETQVMVKDGETIVIGGLIKDVVTKYEIGVPFLSKIPVLGWLFKRSTEDVDKIDLLIFITAKIVKPGEMLPQDLIRTDYITSKFKDEFAIEKQGTKK